MFQVFFLRFIAKKVSARPPNTESSTCYSSSSSSNYNGSRMSDHNEDAQSHILKVYNSSLGRPTAAMHSGMTEEYDAIMKVSNYEEFFERVNLFYSPEQFTKMLRNAVRSSVLRKYTTRIPLSALGRQDMEVIDTNYCTVTRSQTENNQNTPKFTASSTPWSAVWKAYAAEKESGCYIMEKILEIRSRVMSCRKVLQPQQRNRNVDESGRKKNYSSSGNRAANNFNYMQRGNHHAHGNGGSNGPPLKQGYNMGYSTRFHPRSHSANENSASAPSLHSDGGQASNSSYANSLNNSHTRNRPAHTKNILNRFNDFRKSSNAGNSSSGPFAAYNSGSGTSQVGVGQALKNNSGNSNSSSSSNTSYVNTYSSNSNSNSNSYNSNYASVNTKSTVNATAVTGGNSNCNITSGNIIGNGNSNKSKVKVSHKNSTMNNAMSVSGDRVRLHVFYQVRERCAVLLHLILLELNRQGCPVSSVPYGMEDP
jgi:hypothetical protein